MSHGPSHMQRLLVVNADDFGQSDAISDGVCQAARAGAVTSATLLCNCGRSARRAIELASDIPQLGVGVHLNLTEGLPLANPAGVSRLLGPDGRFRHSPAGLLRLSASRRFCGEVLIEWSAQIEWFLSRGACPTHLDSHKHVHAVPPLFEVACTLAEKYEIPFVRRVAEPPWRGPLARSAPPLDKRRRARQWLAATALRLGFGLSARRSLARHGVQSADYFFGLIDTGGWSLQLLTCLLDRLPRGLSELMVHPGRAEAVPQSGRLAQSRPRELAALIAADLPGRAAHLDIRLTHYGRL